MVLTIGGSYVKTDIRFLAAFAVIIMLVQMVFMVLPGPSSGSEDHKMGPVPEIMMSGEYDTHGEGFVVNMGQWDDEVLFGAMSSLGASFFSRTGVKHHIISEDGAASLYVGFDHCHGVVPEGNLEMDHVVNFLVGKDRSGWATGVECYEEIIYEDVWPGIDINYHLTSGLLKYDILISPTADPDMISFTVEGADQFFTSSTEIEIRTSNSISLWDLELSAIYETGEPLDIAFKELSSFSYGFDMDRQEGRTIVIDPILFSTSIGGSVLETPSDMCLDDTGDIYLFGQTMSFDYPNTTGAYDTTPAYLNFPMDVYISKISNDGTQLVFSTYFGGWSFESADGMDVDENHDIYITGYNYQWDFPTTEGVLQEEPRAGSPSSIYVTKFAANGSALVYSTFISSESIDIGGDVAVREGEAYVACYSLGHEFPAPWGYTGGVHGMGFIVGLSRDASSMVDLIGIDGYHGDYIDKILIDHNNDVVVSGHSGSKDCPYTPHSIQYPAPLAPSRSFVAKYIPKTGIWDFISIFGSTVINNIEVDHDNSIYFTGYMMQDGTMDYPTTPGAIDRKYMGSKDMFITKIDTNGTELLSSAQFGAKRADIGGDIDIDPAGNIYWVGKTQDLSTIEEGFNSPHGEYDAFVMKLNNNLSMILNLTYVGGSGNDTFGWCKLVGKGEVLAHGWEGSEDLLIENMFNRSVDSLFLMDMTINSIPSEPVDIGVSENVSRIDLDWAPPIDDGNMPITGYVVYRGNSSINLTPYRELGNVTDFIDDDQVIGMEFFYSVSAVNTLGEGPICEPESNISTTVPSPPINIEVGIEIGAMTITFEPPSDRGGVEILGYRVYRNEIPVMDLDPSILSYVDMEIDNGSIYNYTITAWNRIGESDHSDIISVRSRNHPSTPRDLKCYPGTSSIDIRWGEPLDDGGLEIEMYLLYRGTVPDNLSLYKMLPYDATRFIDHDVYNGIEYFYRLEVMNQMGTSGSTSLVSSMIQDIPQPPILTDAIPGWKSIEISWMNPIDYGGSEIFGYNIYHGHDPEGLIYLTTVPKENTSYLHQGLIVNRLNYYFMTTVTSRGESIPSRVVYERPIVDPSSPVELEVYPVNDGLVINWKAPSTNGNSPIVGYIIYRGIVPGQLVEIGSVIGTERDFLDSKLKRKVDYFYGVKAVNTNGISELSSIVPGHGLFIPDPPMDAKVTVQMNEVVITWNEPDYNGGSRITEYRVLRKDPSGHEVLLDKKSSDSREHVDVSALLGVKYDYYIRSVNQVGLSDPSQEFTVELVDVPSPPINLKADLVGDGVVISWNAPLSENGLKLYSIYRSDDLGDMDLLNNSKDRIHIDLSIEKPGTYEYYVTATNEAGESSASVPVMIEVPETDKETREGGTFIYLVPGAIVILLLLLLFNILRSRRDDDELFQGGEE